MTGIEQLLGRSMPGSAKTRRNTIERAERLCQPISERFGLSSVRQLKAKHLRWALETWAATKSSQTRYDYWRTARCIAAALGRDEDWAPYLRGPWQKSGTGGRRPRLPGSTRIW